MSKWNPGDLVEFIPGNYVDQGYSGKYWYDGRGLIISTEDNLYEILVFNLTKISSKNFAEYEIGQVTVKIPIDECDLADGLKSLED